MEVEGVQIVILTADVEHSEPQLCFALQKAAAGEGIELPKIVSR